MGHCDSTFTELNLGTGGSFMDETLVTYVAAPTERRRERVHIAGCLAEQLTEVLNVTPASDEYGLVVRPIIFDRANTVNQYTQINNTSAETTILTAGGAGVFNDITSISVSTDKTVDVTFRDSSGGSAILVVRPHATNEPNAHFLFDVPLKQTTANNVWTAQLDASNATVDFTVVAIEKT